MKFSKYLMVAAAGLMMTACSQKDENPNGIDGVVALTVNVAGPASRAITDGTAGDNNSTIDIAQSTVELKLTADQGGVDWVEISGSTHTFYDVVNPTKIEVRINGGQEIYTDLTALKDLTPANMQAYGSSNKFDFAGTIENGGKTYDKYTTTVTANIPVGRIEVSGIKHKAHDEGKQCVYSELQIEGLYFDAAATTPNTPADVDFAGATEGLNKEIITGDFLTVPSFPENNKVAAFNFFPSTAMPVLKLVFTGTTKDGMLDNVTRYAVVKAYKANGEPLTAFEAGKVYRIKSVEVADDDFTGDESGNTTVAVEVTVEVQDWTIVDTTVEF